MSSRLGARSTATLALALCLTAWVPPMDAATILRHEIIHTLEDGGERIREEVHLWVKLTEPADLRRWSQIPIFLNANREVISVSALVRAPDGSEVTVKPKSVDTIGLSGGGTLHSSATAQLIPFPRLEVGSEIEARWVVEETPWFPAKRLFLGSFDDPVATLHVEVRGAPQPLDFLLERPLADLAISPTDSGLLLRGEGLEHEGAPSWAPGDLDAGPVLHYGWEGADWDDVAAWYRELVAQLPSSDQAIAVTARELAQGAETTRERLEEIVDFVRSQVRYVAVEVGIGGFRPSPPGEVLERRWGDCKDKSLLLVELLNEAGIEAWPTLIRLSHDERVPTELASPFHFNHAIAAVNASDFEPRPSDPTAEGFLFVDPTQEHGSARWLHPGVQDQTTLVVTDSASHLVTTPTLPATELTSLSASLDIAEDGSATGEARLEILGDGAWRAIRTFADADESAIRAGLRQIFAAAVPRAELLSFEWQESIDDLPRVVLDAKVRVRRLVQGRAERRSLHTPHPLRTPEPSLLDERTAPVVLTPGTYRLSLRLHLPESWCLPEGADSRVDTPPGLFEEAIEVDETRREIQMTREIVVRQRWIEPAGFDDLAELARAEHAAARRRIRLRCEESPQGR